MNIFKNITTKVLYKFVPEDLFQMVRFVNFALLLLFVVYSIYVVSNIWNVIGLSLLVFLIAFAIRLQGFLEGLISSVYSMSIMFQENQEKEQK